MGEQHAAEANVGSAAGGRDALQPRGIPRRQSGWQRAFPDDDHGICTQLRHHGGDVAKDGLRSIVGQVGQATDWHHLWQLDVLTVDKQEPQLRPGGAADEAVNTTLDVEVGRQGNEGIFKRGCGFHSDTMVAPGFSLGGCGESVDSFCEAKVGV